LDEPEAGGDDWIEWGGELYYDVGTTSGGAPYGPTQEQFRENNERYERTAPWAIAKVALRRVLEGRTGGTVDVGYVRHLGAGFSSNAFFAEVGASAMSPASNPFVASVPRPDADPKRDERAIRELAILARLSRLQLPFRVAQPVGAVREAGRLVTVRQFLPGIGLPWQGTSRPGIARPWEVVAQVAAAVHTAETAHVQEVVRPAYRTRREHGEAELAAFEGLDGEFQDARVWAAAHLPPDEPSQLIHGDLLPQNILAGPESLAVLDWEHACMGDPASDLAIVTRGVKRPFGVENGFRSLISAYAAAGGPSINPSDVRFYELCLLAHQARSAGGEHDQQEVRNRVGALLRFSERTSQSQTTERS
jgi:aminoglycoside phosphotransferase (APT) family kinase protein